MPLVKRSSNKEGKWLSPMNTRYYIRLVQSVIEHACHYPLLFDLHYVAFFHKAKRQMLKLLTSTLRKINGKRKTHLSGILLVATDQNKGKYFALGRPCEKMHLAARQHYPSIRCDNLMPHQ